MAKSESFMKPWMWVVGVIVLVGLLLVGWMVGTYNTLVSLNTGVDKAWGDVETNYQRRFDLIPNLVETVKGYAKQETQIFTEVAAVRSQWAGAATTDDKMRAAQASDGVIGRLIAVAEAYPELMSNTNFLALQDELAGTENRISVSRQRFNEAVGSYNIKVKTVPSNIVASLFGFEIKDMFKSESGADKAVKVAF